MNKTIMNNMGFGDMVRNVERKVCPFCKAHVNPEMFKDESSRGEYKISGLCQKCQDEVFGSDE